MAHYGFKDGLPFNGIYRLEREPDNRYDHNAVRVCDLKDGRTVGYFTRSCAKLVKTLFNENLSKNFYCKVKSNLHAVKKMQLCGVGFYVEDQNINKVEDLLLETGLVIKYLPLKKK